jgi:hypothetical protein
MLHHVFDDRPWFKPKRFGLGAYPATWQGWMLTVAYVGAVTGLATLRQDGALPNPAWWALFVGVTGAFVAIAWRKTRGGWHWHRGGDDGGADAADRRRDARKKRRESRG